MKRRLTRQALASVALALLGITLWGLAGVGMVLLVMFSGAVPG